MMGGSISSSGNNKTNKALHVGMDKSSAEIDWTHHVAIWLWIGWIFWYLLLLVVYTPIIYAAVVQGNEVARRVCWYTLTIFLVLIVLPCDRKFQPAFCLKIGEFIANRASEYFHMKVLIEDEDLLKKSSPAFFVVEPHDVLPLSIIAFSQSLGAVKGHQCYGCITSMCFLVPFMRHFYSWAEAVPATKEKINELLSSGCSPVICPGGVQEAALITSKNEINVFLKKRKGFIKIAISHGAPIVPVFCFGLRNSFDFWLVKSSLFMWFGRKIGFMPMVFFGNGGLPFGPAKPCEYVNVVGVPIPCPKREYKDITDAEVDAIHEQYLSALVKLFETHKTDYGCADTKLNIH